MLEKVQEDQHGTFIRLPKELGIKAGDCFDVVSKKSEVIVLYPDPIHQKKPAHELLTLFKDWKGLDEPEVDEWMEHEGSTW